MNCDGHEWIVFSTCIGTIELMCSCRICGAFGVVQKPTKEEWGAAFNAPNNPYLWKDNDRVVIKEVGHGG